MRGENGLMDELRKLLKEGKLNFRQYFIVAFEVFKDMLKNDNNCSVFINGTFHYIKKPFIKYAQWDSINCSCDQNMAIL